MPRPLLFRLLGVCLLLSQLPRELSAQQSSTVKKLCGHELVRARKEACSKTHWGMGGSKGKPSLKTHEAPDLEPSSIKKDAKTTNEFLEFTPDIHKKVTENEKFSRKNPKIQSEAEDNSLPETESLSLDQHSRKKKMLSKLLRRKCCKKGCTMKELSRAC
ncbi:prorelaxin-like [Trichechus manatus latirostris]|uniref:Prorelaxin-like n=1 Tax=Trichechus manatus latirostris TaxID=127582 RepID=A0A2Y9FVY8_TRIMA|nr:prorelaxin-like [Trichechus manatus latirostris]